MITQETGCNNITTYYYVRVVKILMNGVKKGSSGSLAVLNWVKHSILSNEERWMQMPKAEKH